MNAAEATAVQAAARHLLSAGWGDDSTVEAMRALSPLVAAASSVLRAGLTATDWAEAIRLWDAS